PSYGLFLLLDLSVMLSLSQFPFLFFHAPPPTEIYPLSLHDALPIFSRGPTRTARSCCTPSTGSCSGGWRFPRLLAGAARAASARSEEHTSELQSRVDLVCRLLLEKKKKKRLE